MNILFEYEFKSTKFRVLSCYIHYTFKTIQSSLSYVYNLSFEIRYNPINYPKRPQLEHYIISTRIALADDNSLKSLRLKYSVKFSEMSPVLDRCLTHGCCVWMVLRAACAAHQTWQVRVIGLTQSWRVPIHSLMRGWRFDNFTCSTMYYWGNTSWNFL